MENNSIYETSAVVGAESSGAAERALDILEFLEARAEPQTLSQIVEGLHLPRASAHRLLATLRARGYIQQPQPRGGYTLGLRVLRLAARARERLDLVGIVHPVLSHLAAVTGESCQVSVRSGGQALCVARVVSPEHPDVSLAGQVGSAFPLHASAVGKVLLAYAPAPERDAYLAGPLPGYTPQTHISPDALAAELAAVRGAGLARDSEEYKRGLSALAAPIFDAAGQVRAAIAVPLLTAAGDDTIPLKEEALRSAAADISRALGCYSGDFDEPSV